MKTNSLRITFAGFCFLVNATSALVTLQKNNCGLNKNVEFSVVVVV